MGTEIERKFLVAGDGWKKAVTRSSEVIQGYLSHDPAACVRIRLVDGKEGWLTVKGEGKGAVRPEFEYRIPAEDASEMIAMCGRNVLEKRRHIVPAGELQWEIDVFRDRHDGLTLAEIELPSAEHPFEQPDWLGDEVTGNASYLNQVLACGQRQATKRKRRASQ
ncbi:MAG: CYTH domain-containing protein [Mesorhizobium sp.]|nr:MAG: CYTH domain-containing protein [Mesorhizobium sp.]